MMRPRYETPEQHEAENRTAQRVANAYGHSIERVNDDNAPCDFIVTDRGGTAIELWEVKNREIRFGQYEDFFISESKMKRLLDRARRANLRAVLVIGLQDFTCTLEIHDVDGQCCRKSLGGRDDRGDAMDVEPMVHFRWGDFHKVAEKLEFFPPPTEIYKYM